jgi:hypothetical protein
MIRFNSLQAMRLKNLGKITKKTLVPTNMPRPRSFFIANKPLHRKTNGEPNGIAILHFRLDAGTNLAASSQLPPKAAHPKGDPMNIADVAKSVTTGMPSLLIGGQPGYRAGNEKLAWFKPALAGPSTVIVESEGFGNMASIPTKYSADHGSISPPLRWSNVPAETQSLALVVEDPDAPTPNPFVHWLLYNIAADIRSIPENVGHERTLAILGGAQQGKNSGLKIGWTGMAPPLGDIPHHYHFQLFALSAHLPLDPGAGRSALLEAMAGHVVGRGEIVGTYQR